MYTNNVEGALALRRAQSATFDDLCITQKQGSIIDLEHIRRHGSKFESQ